MVKNATSSKSDASPDTSAQVIQLPDAFKSHDPKMSPVALALAVEVGKKHPAIVASVVELRSAITQAGEKYYTVLHALRSAKLQKKEATAVLLGLGLTKGRASELNKLSACSDEVWAKYSSKAVGFRAALALENGETDGESSPGGTGEETEAPAKRKKHKIHSVPKPLQSYLIEFGNKWLDKDSTLPDATKSGKRTEYGFTVESNGKTLYFSIFADKAD